MEEVIRCERSSFLVQTTPDFSKLMVCPYGQGRRELSQSEQFADKGGQFFTILCGRLLLTAPNAFSMYYLLYRMLVQEAAKGPLRWSLSQATTYSILQKRVKKKKNK